MTFHIPNAGVLHGLAGYFEAVLYRDVGLSIHPEGMDHISPGMLSWFPLFFPFRVRMLCLVRTIALIKFLPRTLYIYPPTLSFRYQYGESPESRKSGMNGTLSRTYRS